MALTGLAAKNKNRIFNIAIIILALIIASNIYKHQLKKIESLKSKKDTEIKKNAVMENISKEEKTVVAYKNLLAKRDAGYTINTVINIAKESGVKIMSIKPTQEQRVTDYIRSSFNLVLNAPNYHILGNFISKLESYQDVYIVEAIEIKSEAQSKGLTANLTVDSVAFTD